MKILNKFVINDLKLNKKRSITSIIAITLSFALMFCTICMLFSLLETFKQHTIEENGDYHAIFYDVENDYQEVMKNDEEISDYFITQSIGYSHFENSLIKSYIYLMQYDEKAFNHNGIELISGRMPTNSNEIIISEHFIQNEKLLYQIGDQITLDLYRYTMLGDQKLDQKYIYFKSLFESEMIEQKEIFQKEYTIVGIMKRPSTVIEPYSSAGYTAITLLEHPYEEEGVNIFLKLKAPSAIMDKLPELKEKLGTNKIRLNSELLSFYGVFEDKTVLIFGIMLVAAILLIIIVCSVVCIKSNFLLSITEKMKHYSTLVSMGAERKHIIKCVLMQSLLLGIAGIALGLMLGSLITWLLIYIINLLVTDIHIIFSMPVIAIFLTILLTLLVIYLSSISPAKKATQVSPITGIKENESIYVPASEKESKWIKKLFGIGGLLSYKNIKRDQSKYKSTVISLITSIVLFIVCFVIVKTATNLFETQYKDINYNVSVSYISSATEKEKYDYFKKVATMEEVDRYMLERSIHVKANLFPYVTKEGKVAYQKVDDDQNHISIALISLGEGEYQRFIRKINKSYDQCKNGIIYVTTNHTYMINEHQKKIKLLDLKAQNKINCIIDGKSKEITIVEVTNEVPMGLENTSSMTGFFVISDELLESLKDEFNTNILYINSSNPTSLSRELRQQNEKLNVTDITQEIQENKQKMLLLSIMLYGFVAIIFMIGITNIINTINNTIQLRIKEFAILRSIGVTKKGFKEMMHLESIFYCLKSLMIGIFLGIVISILIYFITYQIIEIKYEFPWLAIVVSILVVILSVTSVMNKAFQKIAKENIIESIRNENI